MTHLVLDAVEEDDDVDVDEPVDDDAGQDKQTYAQCEVQRHHILLVGVSPRYMQVMQYPLEVEVDVEDMEEVDVWVDVPEHVDV